MASWIKGPYSLQETVNVGATSTKAVVLDSSTAGADALTVNNRTAGGNGVAIGQYTADRTTANKALLFIEDSRAGTDENTVRVTNAGSGSTIHIITTGAGPDILIDGRASASIGAAAEGAIAYDTTLHKLKVRGAAGWETITSI